LIRVWPHPRCRLAQYPVHCRRFLHICL
jgi:hypothetical protein